MDERELQALVERISLDVFHKPFRHRAVFNDRLRTTGGRYVLSTHHIELNRKYYEQYGEEELIQVIKHELCHYHLYLEGKGYRHRDRDFRELLQKVQAPRFCKPVLLSKTKKEHYYKCTSCRYMYVRRKALDTTRYVCGFCRGKLKKIKREC
ncbi:SprT family protein [Anoxybacillus flavithermus]|uniref:Protein SprT-like n=1 Tax=Anoxybacillus flavithermus (strain DSM 21510 / WK1) TaxID=491915 RepID=SPRTL_ANOFW|nr:SprT family protein [Anoxybacillus flavithermus]B7GFQ0.1 RecName: Full=Protein SprT-like [Anoxybacillus flavithermus WK1]ACJ32586.1 Zn-dependent metalloprotease, SprT family [Anoxybacillus flavithermus WK1]